MPPPLHQSYGNEEEEELEKQEVVVAMSRLFGCSLKLGFKEHRVCPPYLAEGPPYSVLVSFA